MVSLAMVMLLIVGVYAVFDSATKTVGIGTAVERVTKSQRSLERQFHDDFSCAVPAREMPCVVIYSQQIFAFADQKDRDGNSGLPPNLLDLRDGTGPKPLAPAIYNLRSHRADRIAFFARRSQQPFLRQTGNNSELVTTGSSSEAWIWYGHLNLPGASANQFFGPDRQDQQDCPNNYFANDWCLGRSAILLDPLVSTRSVPGATFIPYDFSGNTVLTPLGADSRIPGGPFTRQSLCDVAEVSIADFRTGLDNVRGTQGFPSSVIAAALDYRFNALLQVDRTNLANMPHQLAQTVPFLQRGVTQFIIEFAGDFISQNTNTGQILNKDYPSPDGEIDFLIKTVPGAPPRKQIRWYGMPRNVDESDDAAQPVIRGKPRDPSLPNDMLDVTPLRDVCVAASIKWRGEGYPPPNPNIPTNDDIEYLLKGTAPIRATSIPDYASVSGGLPAGAQYIAIFTPERLSRGRGPRLIRITMVLADPNSRLPEGQTVQYVFALPQ